MYRKAVADADCQRLYALLGERGGASTARTQGILCAAAMHPSLDVRPSQWLPLLLPEREFDTLGQAQEIMSLVMSAYNDTVSRLDQRQLELPSKCQVDELREWCTGFWETMNLNPDWEDDKVAWKALGPVVLVASESQQENPEKVKAAINCLDDRAMREAVYAANVHFKDCRAATIRSIKAEQRVKRESAAIGRNDPCPCGSGKKFKRCCLKRDGSTLH